MYIVLKCGTVSVDDNFAQSGKINKYDHQKPQIVLPYNIVYTGEWGATFSISLSLC